MVRCLREVDRKNPKRLGRWRPAKPEPLGPECPVVCSVPESAPVRSAPSFVHRWGDVGSESARKWTTSSPTPSGSSPSCSSSWSCGSDCDGEPQADPPSPRQPASGPQPRSRGAPSGACSASPPGRDWSARESSRQAARPGLSPQAALPRPSEHSSHRLPSERHHRLFCWRIVPSFSQVAGSDAIVSGSNDTFAGECWSRK